LAGIGAVRVTERAAIVSPSPRLTSCSAVSTCSTSRRGTSATPASCAAAANCRRVGSSKPWGRVVEDQRRLGEPRDREPAAGAGGIGAEDDDLVAEQRSHVELAVVDGQDDEAGLELAGAHRRGDVGRVLPRQLQARVGVDRAEARGQAGDVVVGRVAEHAHRHDAVAPRCAPAPDRCQRVVGGLGDALGVAQERAAGAGQREAAATAREQARSRASRSSCRTCSETAGCVQCRARAAALNDPSEAAVRKYRSC